MSVSPSTIRTDPTGTASSSATSSASAVRVPWPASTLPVNAVTEPSAPTCTQASSGAPEPPGGCAPLSPVAATVTRPSGSSSKNEAASLAAWSHGSGAAVAASPPAVAGGPPAGGGAPDAGGGGAAQ